MPRELENVIECAVISSLQFLDKLDSSSAAGMAEEVTTLEEVEHNHIARVLEKTKWKIYGPDGAALLLGLNPSTLRFRIRKLGIQRSCASD
jgi:transcriptional regulator with GAF, ATPase, and Fis domain